MKRYTLVFAAVCFGMLMLGLDRWTGMNEYIAAVKRQREEGLTAAGETTSDKPRAYARGAFGQVPGDRKEQVAQQVQAEAEKRRIAPVNAKLDPVWKAVPGYNGVEVDVEATMKLAEQAAYQGPPKLVLREVEPAIGLEQLGAHPVYKGNPNKPMTAFMINVAWGDEFLPGMLETLRKERVHATFFLDGTWLKKNADTAKRIAAEGHELSNHGYSHRNMSQLNRAQASAEISKTEVLLRALGVNNTLFAPPSGDYDQETVVLAREFKLQTVLWTLDTIDWKKPDPSFVVRKIASRVEPGSLILMHPTAASSQALPGMIRAIRAKGLTPGTVSEVISSKRMPEVESAKQ